MIELDFMYYIRGFIQKNLLSHQIVANFDELKTYSKQYHVFITWNGLFSTHITFENEKKCPKIIFFCISSLCRVYSEPLLGVTIAPNLVPLVRRKIFSLEMVKNDFCLVGASKQNALFSEIVPQKNTPMPPMSRADPGMSFDSFISKWWQNPKCALVLYH